MFSVGFSYFLDLGNYSGRESLRNGPTGVSGLLRPGIQIVPVQSRSRPAALRSEESGGSAFLTLLTFLTLLAFLSFP